MECARLDEPSDPEMGGSQAVRLRFRLLRLGLEQFVEAALDELLLGLTTEMFAFSVNIPSAMMSSDTMVARAVATWTPTPPPML
jgi:hypothetical protein